MKVILLRSDDYILMKRHFFWERDRATGELDLFF